MFKKFALALMPFTLLASVNADDLQIDVASIADADVEIVENDLDINVDALASEAGEDSQEDAVEACFRRFGYNYRGWGHGFHNSCFGGYYNSCYNYCQPLYSYRTICYSPPVYRVIATPIYHYYWGCH